MSQPSVTTFFNLRKRQVTEQVRNKAKVRVVEENSQKSSAKLNNDNITEKESEDSGPSTPLKSENSKKSNGKKIVSAEGKMLNFEGKVSSTTKIATKTAGRARVTRSRNRNCAQEGQADIRDTLVKMCAEAEKGEKIVPYEDTPMPRFMKNSCEKIEKRAKKKQEEQSEKPADNSVTPNKLSFMDRLANQNFTLGEISNRINRSSRLAELKASIGKIRNCQDKLEKLEREGDAKKSQINKFQKSRTADVRISPSKAVRTPSKALSCPVENIKLSESTSSQNCVVSESNESPVSAVNSSPTKAPAYQKYHALVDSGTTSLPLPYNYRFLAEAFRCVDTVAGMLFNRKEVITFKKLKPAVQELLRRNFTLEHLAQIKTIYPDAYEYSQEKLRNFGSASKQDRFELVLKPLLETKNGGNTTDPDNVQKSAVKIIMGPGVLLERRRKFYNVLLEKVKIEHEKFLLNLDCPMRIPKEKITRWHAEFDVESCGDIELAELPQAPNVEKAQSAMQVLEKAKTLFNCDTRMGKALQRLADAKMTSRSAVEENTSATENRNDDKTAEPRKVEITVIDTPPVTPTTQSTNTKSALKGIPKALLERVRAKQAAKALEAMTRTPTADKEAALYSRLPEMAKILRNMFVAERKGVMPLEIVITKLDNSYRTKLTPNELEEHVRLICKLLPTFACLQQVRNVDYLKIAKTADIVKIIKRLELLANDKLKA